MEAGFVWDRPAARTEPAMAGKRSLTVVVGRRPEVDVGRNRRLAGGIVRFGLDSPKGGVEAECPGGIVRFGLGSDAR